MKKGIAMLGIAAVCLWPAASVARMWIGADLGMAGGALTETSPAGVYIGAAPGSFPIGGELSYQFLSLNPARIGMVSATAIYRHPISSIRDLTFLARMGVAYIHASNNSLLDNSTRPIIGAGISYRVEPHMSLRAEYDIVWGPDTHTGPIQNGNELLGGITYTFAS